jgi:capsular polysaccharide transport system permease protein
MFQPFGSSAQMRLPAPGGQTAASAASSRLRARTRNVRLAFLALVVIPTALSALYTSVLATPRYVSEGQFVMRGLSTTHATGFEALFRTFGISRAVDDTNIVENYVLSRDAVKALEERLPLRAMFMRPDIDRIARFPRFWETDTDERFYKYYLDRVSVVQDSLKGISTLKVVAFSAEDARKIATELLALAEDLANRLNMRAQNDSVGSAEDHVASAERDVVAAQAALTDFRNKDLLVDPGKNSESQLGTITALSMEFAETNATMRETSLSAASSPMITALRAKADALQERIVVERAKLAGSDEALAGKVSEYERLTLNRDLADKTLSAAIESLELARQDARRQLIYVEQIVAPNLPDESTEPNVLRTTSTFFVLGFAIFGVLWIITVGAQEHEQ